MKLNRVFVRPIANEKITSPESIIATTSISVWYLASNLLNHRHQMNQEKTNASNTKIEMSLTSMNIVSLTGCQAGS